MTADRKCVGTDFGGDFVPAKFAILLADHVNNPFSDGFSGGVIHRGILAEFSQSTADISAAVVGNCNC